MRHFFLDFSGEVKSTLSVLKCLSRLIFTSILIIYFIEKIEVMKKLNV
jgi:hypothetical protein